MPIRLKQIHVINAPSIIDKIYGLMRPFMKQEQADKVCASNIQYFRYLSFSPVTRNTYYLKNNSPFKSICPLRYFEIKMHFSKIWSVYE